MSEKQYIFTETKRGWENPIEVPAGAVPLTRGQVFDEFAAHGWILNQEDADAANEVLDDLFGKEQIKEPGT